MKEADNILRILKESKNALDENDAVKINELSNQTINTASLTQDPDNIAVAVMVYALSKIISRRDYRTLSGWDRFYNLFVSSLKRAIEDIENNDLEKFRKDFEAIRKAINKLSGKLKNYVQHVFRKAQIHKASKIHEHGISQEQTVNMLGISLYELAEYVGPTQISEGKENKTMNVKSRVKLAMEMFE